MGFAIDDQHSSLNARSPDERSATDILTWSLTSLRPSRFLSGLGAAVL